MANKNNIVVVFDFDKTIIDVDSDNWVVDELGFTDLFNKLLPTMPWNSLMVCSPISKSTLFRIQKIFEKFDFSKRNPKSLMITGSNDEGAS